MLESTANATYTLKVLVVNFTNILQAAFKRADPTSAKKTVKLSSFFALLGSAHVKATRRTLVILTPGGQLNKNIVSPKY